MNKARYESLSPSQRTAIDNHCTTEWAEKIASPWADFEHAGLAKLSAMPGHDVYKITPEQTALWRKAAEPLKAKWATAVKQAGYDPDAVYADLVAELKKRGALAE
jgi:TRAP-type C4-dicarboxylate transport system substrate-binding protein